MDHDSILKILHHELSVGLKENVPMRNYTTMRVGGVADFFYEAEDVDSLISALKCCMRHNIPYLVMGAGSNVIFSDAGFPGLVIHNITSNISIIADKSQVIADSGVNYARLITEVATHGFGGLEYWFGLPGTIGGAVHNNAETWGHSMSEVVKKLTVMYLKGDEAIIETVTPEWMEFEYRSSKLKKWPFGTKPVILTVTLQLQQQRKDEIIRRMQEYKRGRWDLNQPKGIASAGSYFKNPGGASHGDDVKKRPEDSAGWLLDQSGAKKVSCGSAGVSKQHANFIVNNGEATASDIRQLANELKDKVKEKFGIDLEEETEYLGIWPKG